MSPGWIAVPSLIIPGSSQAIQKRWVPAVLHFALACVLWMIGVGLIVHIASSVGAALYASKTERLGNEPSIDPQVKPDGPYITGTGRYDVEVVGESHYQKELRSVAGSGGEESVNFRAYAALTLEDENPHDPNAVRVSIGGLTVGYLSGSDAERFRETFGELAATGGGTVACKAKVRGGWNRGGGDRGKYGVVLDFPRTY